MDPIPCAVAILFLTPISALAFGFFISHRFWPRRTHWPVLISCLVMTFAAFSLLWQVGHGRMWDGAFLRWMEIQNFSVDFGVRIDGLSASVLAMVTLVGTLIHFYAVGYMADDPDFSRFFLLFHFFLLAMVGLLVSNNYLQMYLFWEAVGLASYLLIGFWYDRAAARAAAWKAFLTNRIGDIGFFVAVALMFRAVGSAKMEDVFAYAPALNAQTTIAIAGLLFWAACAKSAQFPLYVWLPDAMEGPTPVSALMHAATMVTAGVFLMARSWPLLERAQEVTAVMAVIGGVTALGAALFASMKKDLKKILAYSTVSHLGLMMLALGVGNMTAAIFHLITHGFFKALLFLCAGNIIHGIGKSGAATLDEVGGLSPSMRWTLGAFWIGALALGGFPPLAGFFSKELILDSVFEGGTIFLRLLTLLIVIGSSFYIFRMLFLTFMGRRSEQAQPHAHEPGLWMQIPIALLAVGSVCVGALANKSQVQLSSNVVFEGALAPAGFLHALLGETGPLPHSSWWLTLLGLGCAGLGLAVAYFFSILRPSWDWQWRRNHPFLERLLDEDLAWQPLVHRWAANASQIAAFIAQSWENRRWDAWTQSLAETCEGLSEGLSGFSRGLLNEYLWWMLAGAVTLAALIVLQ